MGFSDRKMTTPALVTLALLFGMFSALALAHDGDKGRASEAGREQGYEDGLRHGREDDQRGVGYDLKSDDYKKAERGYRKEYGSKGDYKKGYKQGYEQGYSEGYRGGYSQQSRYPADVRQDRDRRVRDDDNRRDRDRNRTGTRAADFGARQGEHDGYLKGREDRDRNRDFDPERHSDYRKADRGYEREFGDKEDYRNGYRQGFRRTYEDGYGGRGNSRRGSNSGWGNVLGGIFRMP